MRPLCKLARIQGRVGWNARPLTLFDFVSNFKCIRMRLKWLVTCQIKSFFLFQTQQTFHQLFSLQTIRNLQKKTNSMRFESWTFRERRKKKADSQNSQNATPKSRSIPKKKKKKGNEVKKKLLLFIHKYIHAFIITQCTHPPFFSCFFAFQSFHFHW